MLFQSETDTEVIPHLLAAELQQLQMRVEPRRWLLLEALQKILPKLQGAYALAVIWDQAPGALVVARKAAPLLIGLGEGEFLCASDTPALAGFTRTILPMEDGEVALLSSGVELYDATGARQQRMPPAQRWITWPTSASSVTSCSRKSMSNRRQRSCG